MSTLALRRACILFTLILAIQVSIPTPTHAGAVADLAGKAKDFVADHAAAIVTGVVVGVVVTAAVASVVVTVGASTPLAVYVVGAGVGLAAGLVVDAMTHRPTSSTGGSPTGGSPTGGSPTGGTVTGGTHTGGTVTGGTVTGGTVTGGTVTGGTPTGITGGTPPPGGATSGGGPGPVSGTILLPGSRDAEGGGADTTGLQKASDDARWGTQQTMKGPQTPFFSAPTGKAQSYVAVSGPGVKGLEVPGFYAGTACEGSNVGVCGSWKNERSYNTARAGMDDMAFDAHGSPGGSASHGAGMPRGPGEYSPTVLPDGSSPSGGTMLMPPPDDMDSHVVPLMPRKGMDVGEKKQHAEELYALAMQKLNERDFEGAIDDLTRAIKLDPNNDKLYAYRAMAFNLTGDYQAAEKDALKALELNPDNEKAWESLAWAQLKQGKYKEAAESASRVLRLNPQSALAYAIRAFAREKLGDTKGTLEDIKRAAELDARYVSLLQRAQKGQAIYNPNEDHTNLLLYRGRAPERPPLPVRLLLLLADLLVLLFFGAGLLYYKALLKKGRVRDFKEFQALMAQRAKKMLRIR